MKEYSEVTQRWFDADDSVFYVNPWQAAFFLDNSATLLDLFPRGDGKLVYVFSRDDHKRLSKLWRERKHD